MKRTIALVGTPAIAGLVLLGGSPAHAAEKPHHDQHATKAEKRHDRRVEARKDRRADRAAPKPPQDTTTTPEDHRSSSAASSPRARVTGAAKIRGVVSCGVSADRAGASFTVHNGCDTTETITVSVQAQPGPWHRGLCTAGGCHLITHYDVTVEPGTHTITVATGGACWVQVDLKWHGRLIKSNHYVKDCTPPVKPTPSPAHPKPKPPVVTHHIDSHVEGHLTQPGTLPRTGGIPWGEALLGVGFIGGGWTLRRLTRQPVQQTEAWTEATR